MLLRRLPVYLAVVFGLLIASVPCRGQSVINTVAGDGNAASTGDGGQAIGASLRPAGLAVDGEGNIYFADAAGLVIRKVNTAGIISRFAGNGTLGFSGDGGPATNAALFLLNSYVGMAADAVGNVYFADSSNHRIRKVDTAGTIRTVAGNGLLGFSGDGGAATSATLFRPSGVAVDTGGNLYIADVLNTRVRKVDTNGIIRTVAGSGALGFSGDGGPATSAAFNAPGAVAVDSAGNLYIADQTAQRVRKVDTSGIIRTVAGNGTLGFAGDGGPATSAQFSGIVGIAVDSAGNLYIVDRGNHRIRKVDTAGIITTVAGLGTSGFSGDGGPATSARLALPNDVAVDASGNLYIADLNNNRVRKVSAGPVSVPITANPSSLSFTYTVGGALPAPQMVSLSSVGVAVTYTASTSTPSSPGFNWLTIAPSVATTPITASVAATPVTLAPGVYDGTVTLTPTAPAGPPIAIAVTLTINGATSPPPGAPTLFAGGIVNGSSFARAPAPVAPGSIVAIFGSGLATGTSGASAIPLPTTLAGAQVLMNGRPVALFAVSPGQINAQVPWELRGSTTMNVRVAANGAPTNTVVTNLAGSAPGIFTVASSGSGPGIIVHTSNGSLVTAANPAARSEFLALFCSGLGPVLNQPPTGSAGPSNPLSTNVDTPTATIGNMPATVFFSGLTPGFVGLYQVNLQVPANAPLGDSVPLSLTVGGQPSNTVTLAIR